MSSTVGRLIIAAVGLTKTRFFIRTVGFARTVTAMNALPYVWPQALGVDPLLVAEIDWAAKRFGGSCLDRSVFLWFVLRQQRLDPELRIGVTRADGGIDGHAWVELDGAVINDAPDIADHFTVFDEDPTSLVFR